MLKKALLLGIVAASVLLCGGCETCTEMTDGGPVQHNWQSFLKEDDAYSQDFLPSIKRWWKEEKTRWPKFKNNCLDAETCYEQSIAKDTEAKK